MHAKSLISAVALVLLSLTMSIGAAAQSEALPQTRITRDPALQSMAGAGFMSDYGNAYAAFGTSGINAFSDKKMDAGLSYLNWGASSTNYINAGVSAKIGDRWAVSAAFSYGAGAAYEEFDESGKSTGNFKPNDILGGVGVGFKATDWLSVGLNGRFASNKVASDVKNSAVCGDVYAAARFGGFRVALGAFNLGTPVKNYAGDTYPLPASAKLALGYYIDLNKNHIEVNADADYFFKSGIGFAAGAAYSYNGYITARAGYRYGGKSAVGSYASFGLGTSIKGIRLDAGYLLATNKAMGNSFTVGLGYSF